MQFLRGRDRGASNHVPILWKIESPSPYGSGDFSQRMEIYVVDGDRKAIDEILERISNGKYLALRVTYECY